MDRSQHTLNTLFAQLGLPSDDADVEAFIARHRPLAAEIRLQDATLWNASQSHFLAEGLEDDSDWAEVIDTLDARLRQ
ncbi:MAG: DUF2789 domain-containing protein [Halomonadaceae bacterium]|nr:MAG: DUF2789 domain-containing protein [Halomonadaceae bacterium]